MSKVQVFYVHLTDEQIAELNREGWDSEIGKRYSAAKFKDGYNDPEMYRHAATVELKVDTPRDAAAEAVWVSLQNTHYSWTDHKECTAHIDFTRSCDLGDLIVFDDGTVLQVQSVGFREVECEWASSFVLNPEREAHER